MAGGGLSLRPASLGTCPHSVASWAEGETQVGILGAGAKRGPHRHARTARACCRMNVLSGLGRIGTFQTLRFARWWKLGPSRHTGVPGTANCFSPGDHSPSLGNDSRHRRLQVGFRTSSRAPQTVPTPKRGACGSWKPLPWLRDASSPFWSRGRPAA